jgi:hypothetical protein
VYFCWLLVPFPILGQLKKIVKDYYDRMYICEEQKWDLEREVRKRDWEVPPHNILRFTSYIQRYFYHPLVLVSFQHPTRILLLRCSKLAKTHSQSCGINIMTSVVILRISTWSVKPYDPVLRNTTVLTNPRLTTRPRAALIRQFSYICIYLNLT